METGGGRHCRPSVAHVLRRLSLLMILFVLLPSRSYLLNPAFCSQKRLLQICHWL